MISVRLKNIIPWLLPLTIQCCFLYHALSTGYTHTKDSYEYLKQAENLLNEQTFYCGDLSEPVTDASLYSRRPPGYGIFILLSSFFLRFPEGTLILQALLSVINLWLGYLILKLIIPGFRKTWLYIIPASLIPSQFALGTVYMSEIPFQTTILLSIFFLIRHEQKNRSYRYLILHHCFLFLAYMIKPVAVFIWLFSVIYLIIREKGSRSVPALTIITMIHLFIIGGMMVRNYHLTGIADYSSIGHKVLLNYNMPHLLDVVYGPEASAAMMEELQAEMTGQSYQIQRSMANQFVRQQVQHHFPAYLMIHLKGMFKFFIDAGRWELELIFSGQQDQAGQISWIESIKTLNPVLIRQAIASWPVWGFPYYLLSASSTLICLAGCMIWFIRKKTGSGVRLLFAGLLLYFSVLTGPSASARFRNPVSLIPVITTLLLIHQTSRRINPSGTNVH